MSSNANKTIRCMLRNYATSSGYLTTRSLLPYRPTRSLRTKPVSINRLPARSGLRRRDGQTIWPVAVASSGPSDHDDQAELSPVEEPANERQHDPYARLASIVEDKRLPDHGKCDVEGDSWSIKYVDSLAIRYVAYSTEPQLRCNEPEIAYAPLIGQEQTTPAKKPAVVADSNRPDHSSEVLIAFLTTWHTVFRYYWHVQDRSLLREHFSLAIADAKSLLDDCDPADLYNWLSNVDEAQRVQATVRLLVGSLLTSPRQIIYVLSNLGQRDGDFMIRARCLQLTGWLYKSDLNSDQELAERFDAEVDELRSSDRWLHQSVPTNVLRLLVWRSNEAQLQTLFSNLDEHCPEQSDSTLRFLIMFCATRGMPDRAFEYCKALSDEEIQRPSIDTYKAISKVLEHDTVDQTPSGLNFRYLPPLLERGLVPDSRLYHRILLRAIGSGFPGVAWDIFCHLRATGAEIHWMLCYTMLEHFHLSKDSSRVREILSVIDSSESLYTQRNLLCYMMNMVRTAIHAETNISVPESQARIIAIFDRAYQRAPLIKLRLASSEPASVAPALVEADSYMVSFAAFSLLLCRHDTWEVGELWDNVVRLVKENDKTVLRCLTQELIYNAFIYLFCKHRTLLPRALEVLQHMLEHNLCLPTSWTWTLIICGFLRHEEDAQARQLRNLMRAHGFEIKHIRGEVLDRQWTIQDLKERLEDILDEHKVSPGMSSPEKTRMIIGPVSEQSDITEEEPDVEESATSVMMDGLELVEPDSTWMPLPTSAGSIA